MPYGWFGEDDLQWFEVSDWQWFPPVYELISSDSFNFDDAVNVSAIYNPTVIDNFTFDENSFWGGLEIILRLLSDIRQYSFVSEAQRYFFTSKSKISYYFASKSKTKYIFASKSKISYYFVSTLQRYMFTSKSKVKYSFISRPQKNIFASKPQKYIFVTKPA